MGRLLEPRRGNVDVDVGVFENPQRRSECAVPAPDQAERGLRGFFHDVSDLAGQRMLPLPGYLARLNVENLAAHRRVSEAGHDARFARLQLRSRTYLAGPRDRSTTPE